MKTKPLKSYSTKQFGSSGMIAILVFLHVCIGEAKAQFSNDFELESREVIITMDDETIHAHVLDDEKEIKAKSDLKYAWYTRNMLMQTQGGYSGHVLHGPYKSHYRNQQVRTNGLYHYGLKHKEWREWDEQGQLVEISNWEKGVKTGPFAEYREGELVKSGSYKDGKLHGKYEEFQDGEVNKTLKFKNGKEKPTKVKEPKPEKEKPEKTPKEKTARDKKEKDEKTKESSPRKSERKSSTKQK